LIWVGIVWSIWKHINNIIFRNQVPDIKEVFTLSQVKTWTWITNRIQKANFTYSDWLRILYFA